ncbi:RNA-binding protein Nova-1-like [Acanthaster planci]|uniref:RNA-binding protein Nova-1-like n=1 Tax=Acanthaster planci TaxID=133434 RepID=A0A8B7YDD1_ACAPL|nr:RNA-binding protein Nova-1-like [Acanthaster planci]
MATAEFVGPHAAGSLGPMHPMHSVVGQPIIDMGLNGESMDSRKRPLEGEVECGVVKRSNTGNGDDTKYMLKMLIPSTVAGSIIGKGGQTIAKLQVDTKTVIKLSKNNDFYPGTTERVALITGTVDALNNVCSFIIDKLKESQQQVTKTGVETNLIPPDRARQVKVVVPNSTAGLIIGKAGAMIKHIMEQSASRVQISQKSDGITLTERVITITGEAEPNKKALSFIIDKVQEDPQSGSCNNLSYATATFPVANANPTGSPFAEGAVAAVMPANVVKAQIPVAPVGLTGLPATALGTPSVSITPQSYARVPTTVSYSTGDAAAINALNTLASYNYTIGGLPMSASIAAPNPLYAGTPAHLQPTQMIPSGLLGAYQVAAVTGNSKTTLPTPLNLSSPAAAESPVLNGSPTLTVPSHHLQESSVPSIGMAAPMGSLTGVGGGLGAIALAQEPPQSLGTKDPTRDTILEVEVPENLVGAILGKRGQTLVEFQTTSGAKIQISKKGEYVPGTRNRKVTITGAPNQAQLAHFFITQKVAQEEQNRALKGTT